MVTVFLAGDSKNDYGKQVCEILSSYVGVLHISGDKIGKYGRGLGVLLIEANSPQITNLKKGIVLLQKLENESELKIPNGFSVFVESENISALKMLEKTQAQIIVGGLTTRDTLSISSVSQKGPSVSLQREIVSIFGESIEPCELPINCSCEVDEFVLLAVATVLITGAIER